MARILLADDDRGSLDLVGRALAMDGHIVTAAEDGTDAVAKLALGPYDVLVADVQMPGLDGIALAQVALKHIPGLRLVMMSGFADVLEKARLLRAPALRIVTKPFSIDQITMKCAKCSKPERKPLSPACSRSEPCRGIGGEARQGSYPVEEGDRDQFAATTFGPR